MSTTRKPVIIRKLTQDWCSGYVFAHPARENAELELLDSAGKLILIDWNLVKWVCYVRELGMSEDSARDHSHPERLLRRRFSSRPRLPGLWLRIVFADGDELEGIAPNDHSLVDGRGLLLTPPDTRSNVQRVFVPRSAIRELTVLSVIHPSVPRSKSLPELRLFEGSLFEDTSKSGPTQLQKSEL